MDKNSVGRGLEVDVGSRYDSLLFANTMKMLGTMDDKLKNHLIFRLCPYCWEFVFEFPCRHAGYGNRTGQMLAQVITPHTVRIIVEYGRVTSAIMDEKWDMLEQKMIDSNNPIISVNSTVFEGAYYEFKLISNLRAQKYYANITK